MDNPVDQKQNINASGGIDPTSAALTPLAASAVTDPGIIKVGTINNQGQEQQALSTNNPPPDQGTKINTLTSEAATNFTNDIQAQRDAAANNPNLTAVSNPYNSTNGAQDYMQGSYTNGKLTPSAGPAQGINIQQAAQSAFAPQEDKIVAQYNEQARQLADQKAQADATQGALNFKMGLNGTAGGAGAMQQLDQKFTDQQTDLDRQKQNALDAAWNAALSGQVGAAQKSMAEVAGTDAASAALAKQQADTKAQIQDTLDKQITDFNGFATAAIESGQTINNFTPQALQAMFPNMTATQMTTYFGAAQAVADTKKSDDATTQLKNATDAAKAVSDFLDTQPTGTPVQIGDTTYIGTGRANLKTGVEVDKTTGEGMAYSYDPATKTTTTTPMGTVGFGDPGWTIEKDDSGALWRVSADGGTYLPMTPGPSQLTNNAVLPEGSTGPTLPGSEAFSGQCAAYVNAECGTKIFGSTIQQKTEALKNYPPVKPEEIQTNNTFVYKSGTTGHVGFVGDVIHNPKTGAVLGFMADESNMVPPGQGKVSYSRFVPINDPKLVGFADVPTPNKVPTGSDSPITMAANGNASNLTAKGSSEPTGYGVFGGATSKDETPLSAAELTAHGLDPTDPQYAALTQSGLAAAMKANSAAGPVDTTKALSNTVDEGFANQLANGDMSYSQFIQTLGRAGGAAASKKEQIEARASAINPDFSPASAQSQYDYASSPNTQQAITTINTVMPNIDAIIGISDAVKRSDYPAVNATLRSLGYNVGNKDISNLNELQNIISDELGKALAGNASLSDQKLQQAISSVDTNNSATNFASQMGVVKNALENRKTAIYDRAGAFQGLAGANEDTNYTSTVVSPDGKAYKYDLSDPAARLEYAKALKAGYKKQ